MAQHWPIAYSKHYWKIELRKIESFVIYCYSSSYIVIFDQHGQWELVINPHLEGYSSRPVCLYVTLCFWRLLTINS